MFAAPSPARAADLSREGYRGDSLAWKPRGLDKFREPVNGFLHLTGFVISVLATILLVWQCFPDPARMASAAIFGVSMCGCFLASTLHHLVRGTKRTEMRLLKIDHAAIYPFIAGSYTPVCMHILPQPQGHLLLATVWAIAIAGVLYKLVLAPDPRSVADPPGLWDTLIYILMGWLLTWQLPAFIANSVGLTPWLAALGGLAYSVGGIILTRKLLDFWPGRLGHHEIWHLCVLLGATCVYWYVYLNLV